MSDAITIKDIAKLANVSQSTVSKALNDRPDIGLETKEHILRIAEQHNFLPNASGKALKQKLTENIGVIFRRDDNPLPPRRQSALQQSLLFPRAGRH
ncbi:hypothetical protein DCC62_30730 [candidate division KSB1 bacterium]|nr:MAG: hypothetical protein DCC62_30730 [candidate division KSB1 bacterium]